MNLKEAHRRRILSATGEVTPDYSGYNITRMYATFKSNIATTDNFATLKRPSSASNPQILFDGDGVPDFSSLMGNDWYYEKIMCQITGHYVDAYVAGSGASSQYAMAYDATTGVEIKNGLTSYKFLGVTIGDGASGTALSEFDSGNDFTVVSVVSCDTSNGNGTILSTIKFNTIDDDRFSMFCDRRTNKLASFIRASDVNYLADLDAQIDSSNSRVIASTFNATTGVLKTYENGVLQGDTETVVGSFSNRALMFGAQRNNATTLTGDLQTVIVCDAELNASSVSSLTTLLKTQYGL